MGSPLYQCPFPLPLELHGGSHYNTIIQSHRSAPGAALGTRRTCLQPSQLQEMWAPLTMNQPVDEPGHFRWK